MLFHARIIAIVLCSHTHIWLCYSIGINPHASSIIRNPNATKVGTCWIRRLCYSKRLWHTLQTPPESPFHGSRLINHIWVMSQKRCIHNWIVLKTPTSLHSAHSGLITDALYRVYQRSPNDHSPNSWNQSNILFTSIWCHKSPLILRVQITPLHAPGDCWMGTLTEQDDNDQDTTDMDNSTWVFLSVPPEEPTAVNDNIKREAPTCNV